MNCNLIAQELFVNFCRHGPPKDEVRFNEGLFTLLGAMVQTFGFLSSKLKEIVKGGEYDLPHQ